MENLKDLIIDWVDQNEGIFVLILLAPFWIRVFINSYLINSRDDTSHFILFLNPFSSSAWEHGFESMLRFYWPLRNSKIAAKKIVNLLSIIFLILIIVSIVFSQLFMKDH